MRSILRGFQDAFGGGKVAHDPLRVGGEFLVRHVGLPKQRQLELTSASLWHYTQRYIDRGATRQRHRMVENAKGVAFGETQRRATFGRLGDPVIAKLAQRSGETGSPARKVLGLRQKLIGLRRGPVDRDAKFSNLSHRSE